MASTTVEKELLALEKQFWQAMKENDVDTALRLTDEPCLVTGPQGFAFIDKKTLAGMLQTAPYTLDEFEVKDDAQVRLLSKDVAVLAYKVRETLTVDGKPVTFDAADTSTWIRRDSRWLCASHTESILGDPYGRDRQIAK